MTSMNTLVCQEPKKLHWEKRQIPIPGDDEVLIKIKAVGICGQIFMHGAAISLF